MCQESWSFNIKKKKQFRQQNLSCCVYGAFFGWVRPLKRMRNAIQFISKVASTLLMNQHSHCDWGWSAYVSVYTHFIYTGHKWSAVLVKLANKFSTWNDFFAVEYFIDYEYALTENYSERKIIKLQFNQISVKKKKNVLVVCHLGCEV